MSKAMQLKDRIKNRALKNHAPAQAVLHNFMLECLSVIARKTLTCHSKSTEPAHIRHTNRVGEFSRLSLPR